MLFNKNKHLTRVEASILSVSQWAIRELIPENLKDKQICFTQITISGVPIDTLHCFTQNKDTRYQGFKLKAYFFIEGYPASQKNVSVQSRFLFLRRSHGCFNKKGNKMINWDTWETAAFDTMVVNFPQPLLGQITPQEDFEDIGIPFVLYDSERPWISNPERNKKIEDFLVQVHSDRFDDPPKK